MSSKGDGNHIERQDGLVCHVRQVCMCDAGREDRGIIVYYRKLVSTVNDRFTENLSSKMEGVGVKDVHI